MIKFIVAGAFALGLAGCVSPQMQAKNDDKACQGMGAKPGSDVYVQCRMFKEQQRTQSEASSDAQLAAGMALLNGGGYQQTRLQTNCTSYRVGMSVNTNCF